MFERAAGEKNSEGLTIKGFLNKNHSLAHFWSVSVPGPGSDFILGQSSVSLCLSGLVLLWVLLRL